VKEARELSATALKAISNYEYDRANQSEIPTYPEYLDDYYGPLEWSDGYLRKTARSY